MTYRAEVGGTVVPDMLTAGGTSFEHAASIVAQVSHPGELITVETGEGEGLERRWFKVIAPADGSLERSVKEIFRLGPSNVLRLRGRDD